jgi:hypothetical protein
MTVLKASKILFFTLFLASFVLFILEFLPTSNIFRKIDFHRDKDSLLEEYNPSLSRLNSVEKLENYCDSIYNSRNLKSDKSISNDVYPGIAVEAIKQKFYHGYSYFGISDNYLAKALEPIFINKPVSAIVDPEDIVKYPMAACSQQSILLTKLLTNKGYNVRKVGFYNPQVGGHFAIEVFYNDSWHFYDPNKEMDFAYLQTLNRPSAEFLASNPEILVKAYQYRESETMLKMFPTYFYGKPNKIEGLNALMYQKATKILSYTLWIFFLALYFIARRKEKEVSVLKPSQQPKKYKINFPLKVAYKRKSA